MENLLVVVDMINGFVNFGALADKSINNITPNITKEIETASKNGYDIICFRDAHSLDDEEFKQFPVHCLKGSEESALIPELKRIEHLFKYNIEKNTTNGFITKEFQELLKQKEYDEVRVVGCCTDICIYNFCISYLNYIKKNNLKTKIFVRQDCVDTFNSENHNKEQCNEQSLMELEKNGVVVTRTGNLENV